MDLVSKHDQLVDEISDLGMEVEEKRESIQEHYKVVE